VLKSLIAVLSVYPVEYVIDRVAIVPPNDPSRKSYPVEMNCLSFCNVAPA
jgi:hypothetical protein